MEPMTHAEVETKAKEVFGPNVEVHYSENQWIINTQIEEKFDPEPWRGTPAFEAYEENEHNYGSTLERWMHKNGYGWSSMAEGFEAYNKQNEENLHAAVILVRKMVEDGREFNWPGAEEYRDNILKYAEERGW